MTRPTSAPSAVIHRYADGYRNPLFVGPRILAPDGWMLAYRSRPFSGRLAITTISQTSTCLAASLGGDADEIRAFEQRIGRASRCQKRR
jgi:hypothetical protein